MRKIILSIVFVALFLILSIPASAQVCGDVQEDNSVNVADIVYLIEYLFWGPEPMEMELADVDNRTGITIGDVNYLSCYLFSGGYWPDCSPDDIYNYNYAPDDTIFLPRLYNIPENINEVTLPIYTSFEENTSGFYLPLTKYGTSSNYVFTFSSCNILAYGSVNDCVVLRRDYLDTLILSGCEVSDNFTRDRQNLYSVTFQRNLTGTGDIDLGYADRSNEWRFCIVKNDGDLYIPVVEYIEEEANFLSVSESQVTFTGTTGFKIPGSFEIEITSDYTPINWEATISEDWINIDVTSGTTPSILTITADSVDFDPGTYMGTVTITNTDNPYDPGQEIDVVLFLRVAYQSMDANCDGKFNISDITYMIAYLFGGGPLPCDPCTGTWPEE